MTGTCASSNVKYKRTKAQYPIFIAIYINYGPTSFVSWYTSCTNQ